MVLLSILALMLAARADVGALDLSAAKSHITPVTVVGKAFYAGGSRFYIRGVAYQPGGSSALTDPIADIDGCRRDVEMFQKLGINTIRVYAVDNQANHDPCMQLLADAGIYLALDVNNPHYSLNRDNPGPSYNAVYLQSVFATVDKFAKYDNTLLFFSGNEVIDDEQTTAAAPYIKSVTRDIKEYLKSRHLRKIPVGYSAADVDSKMDTAHYLNCGDESERVDFYAFNDYTWCDPSSFQESGWDQKVKKFQSYSRPIFLSEFGCNKDKRHFGEVSTLYGDEMSHVYSGGIVYEYSQETSKYGLVQISGNSVQPMSDYGALQTAFKNTELPVGTGGADTLEQKPSTCPMKSATWNVESNDAPTIPQNAQRLISQGAGQGPGLQGPGSQNAGSNAFVKTQPIPVSDSGSKAGSQNASSTSKPDSGLSKSGSNVAVVVPFVEGFVFLLFVVVFSTI